MEVKLVTRDLKVTDRLQEYVDKKVSKLDRFMDNISDGRVDLAYVKSARDANDRYVAQITIRGKGYILRAEERADDIFTAIDLTLPKIQRRIKRYKGKHYDRRGEGIPMSEVAAVLAEEEAEQEEPQVVRRKHFILTPMDEREAIEQMELLGHDNFFVFLDANSGKINVLYKRRDGKYGVIEPEVA